MSEMGRKYLHLRLKDLISNAGIRLIQLSFKNYEGIDLYFVRMGEVALYFDEGKYNEQDIAQLFIELGFNLLKEPEDVIVERIRIAAIELIYYANNVNSLIRRGLSHNQMLLLARFVYFSPMKS